MLGYVTNEDAIILGLPSGTPSSDATKRAWEMQDWIEKEEKSNKMRLDEIEVNYQNERKLISYREGFAAAKAETEKPPTATEFDSRDKIIEDFNAKMKDPEFDKLSPEKKRKVIESEMYKVVERVQAGPKVMKEDIGNQIMKAIMESEAYQNHYVASYPRPD